MPTTTNFAFRYPAGTNAVNLVTDVANLATDVGPALYPKVPDLARQTFNGCASTVTFSGIPSAPWSRRIGWTVRVDVIARTHSMFPRINGDAGNYDSQSLPGTGIPAVAGGAQYVTAGPYRSVTFFCTSGNLIAGTDSQLEGWPT